jgi:hypothetical protein
LFYIRFELNCSVNNSLKQDFISRKKVVCLLKKTTKKNHGKEILIVEKSGLKSVFSRTNMGHIKVFLCCFRTIQLKSDIKQDLNPDFALQW